jgi:hypothetical protein
VPKHDPGPINLDLGVGHPWSWASESTVGPNHSFGAQHADIPRVDLEAGSQICDCHVYERLQSRVVVERVG